MAPTKQRMAGDMLSCARCQFQSESLFLFYFLECSKDQRQHMIYRTRNPLAPLSSGGTDTLLSSRFHALLKNLLFQYRRVFLSRNFKLPLSTLLISPAPVCFPGTFWGISAPHHTSHCRRLQASASSPQNGKGILKSEEGPSPWTHRRVDKHLQVPRQGLCREQRLAMQMWQPVHRWSITLCAADAPSPFYRGCFSIPWAG